MRWFLWRAGLDHWTALHWAMTYAVLSLHLGASMVIWSFGLPAWLFGPELGLCALAGMAIWVHAWRHK